MQRFFILSVLFFSISLSLLAQQDTTILSQDQLSNLDIFPTKETEKEEQVISLFGTTEKISDSPYTTYIITKEEIKENGYVTLTDALRTVPGIFVSPLGSAAEGELFMMHGLRGNRYTEIMVNGLSTKPLFAAGMPLGGQMPIRQAERIEIVYGPGTGQFNSGANAALINIVLKNSERPIFTQADMGTGNFRWNNIDVMFGGKLGRGKNLIKFSAWGSSTSFNDWNLAFPADETIVAEQVYNNNNYDNYYGDLRFINQGNYSGSPNTAKRNNFPHQSRQLGIRFQYKKIEFGAGFQSRRDHAALGLNPLSLDYNNPTNYTAETISYLNFHRKAGKKRLTYSLDASFMIYGMDPLSSFRPIQSYIGNAYELNQGIRLTNSGVTVTPAIRDTIYAINQESNFEFDRFRFAESYQFGLRNTFSFKVTPFYKVVFGQGAINEFGTREVSYLTEPAEGANSYVTLEYGSYLTNDYFQQQGENVRAGKLFAFLSNQFRFNKLRLLAGVRLSVFPRVFISPNVSANYALSPNLSLRANYQTDAAFISEYHRSYTFQFANRTILDFPTHSPIRIKTGPLTRTTILETGLYWNINEKNRLDFNFFYNRSNNTLKFDTRPFALVELDTLTTRAYKVGFFTDAGISHQLSGFQGEISSKDFGLKGLDSKISFMIYRGFEDFTRIEEQVDLVPEYPPLLLQWRLSYRGLKSWYFGIENIFQTQSRSAAFFDQETLTALVSDVIVRYKLSRNFDIYVKGHNILNTKYSGISAIEMQDALLYNPQPLARFRLGVHYNME